MIIKQEVSLQGFDFWSGAKATAAVLTSSDFDTIESHLQDLYPDGADETDVNDLFWFEADTIAEWLGYYSFEQLEEDRKEN